MLSRRICCCAPGGPVTCHCECDVASDASLTFSWTNTNFPSFNGSAALTTVAPCTWQTPCQTNPYYNFCGVAGDAYVQFQCSGGGASVLHGFCGLGTGCTGSPTLTKTPTLISHTCSPLHWEFTDAFAFHYFVDG